MPTSTAISLLTLGLLLGANRTATAQPDPDPTPGASLQPAALQFDKRPPDRMPAEGDQEYFVQLEPPGPDKLFRLQSERTLQQRMKQEGLQRPVPERLEFPAYKPLTAEQYVGRFWPSQELTVEPCYVCYRRLLFEDLNSERYGWDLGFVAPFVSAAHFYKDVALLPYHLASDPFRCHECSAGYCLPGDPVPYLLYPPGLTVTGTVGEAGAVLGLLAIFP
jgi:hypothetical protein